MRWLVPFVERLGYKARRRMCPLYVAGLIVQGDSKSVGPMAERVAPGDYDRLHHFASDGVWDGAPLERELAIQAHKLVGGADAFHRSSCGRRRSRTPRAPSCWPEEYARMARTENLKGSMFVVAPPSCRASYATSRTTPPEIKAIAAIRM